MKQVKAISHQLALSLAMFAGSSCLLSAAVRLPAILGSHMVLQQKAPVNFWGWANPSEKVRIMTDWDNTVYDTTADGGGHWQVPAAE